MRIRFFAAVFLTVAAFPMQVRSITYTVAKDGSAQFSSVQEAIDAAVSGDEVLITDTAVYEEQVTIDSTKNGLVLRSENPRSLMKPTIRFKDTINVGPRDEDEALDESKITFDRNGALQIIKASNVRIEGIAVDGGGTFPFGSIGVWGGIASMQHGNSAVVLFMAGEVIVMDCAISNAYIGIHIKDRNEGGVFANPNPADVDPERTIPFSGFAQTGNHLIEYNRIHNNSVGIFVESAWDMGSTVRYNLIYENHHQTEAIAEEVYNLTDDGHNLAGGAFMFKDIMLSPLAIYNNTLWHNRVPFLGHWKAGGQHQIFNNIIGEPNDFGDNQYINDQGAGFNPLEMSKCFANRMHNCVYAAQMQAPTPAYVAITNDLRLQLIDSQYVEGALVTPFPTDADIRWVETTFLSTDPTSPDFLVPDWSDPNIQEFVVDKGWEGAGVKDPDDSRADLGAIPMGGGRPVDVVCIRPAGIIELSGDTAMCGFVVSPRTGTITDVTVTMFGMVADLDTSSGVFGRMYEPISASNISTLSLGTQSVSVGYNSLEVEVDSLGDFAFFEMIIEGTGSNGLPFTSSVGFLPYRKFDYLFDVTILDEPGGTPLTEVNVGETVVLQVSARKGTDPFVDSIDVTRLGLLSRNVLVTPEGDTLTTLPHGIAGSTEIEVVFPMVPRGGVENITVAGLRIDSSTTMSFVGCSEGITIVDPTPVSQSRQKPVASATGTTIEVVNLQGRVVRRFTSTTMMAGLSRKTMREVGSGVYLMRMRDQSSGRMILQKRMVAGR